MGMGPSVVSASDGCASGLLVGQIKQANGCLLFYLGTERSRSDRPFVVVSKLRIRIIFRCKFNRRGE